MNEFGIYLLKSSIWIAVFWLIWALFLRTERFFRFNRIFLLSGLAASLIFPLFHYTRQVELLMIADPVSTLSAAVDSNVAPSPGFSLFFVLAGIYVSGLLFSLFRLTNGLIKIRRLIERSSVVRMRGMKFVPLAGDESSFSFMDYLFINNYPGISEREKELVIRHEEAHVRQYHWLDVVLAQLLLAIQWFNPFMHLYLRAIRQNHEFQADEAVLKGGNSVAQYQAALINHTFRAPVFSFVNSFASSNKNRRIMMMKKEIVRHSRKYACFLLIPALGLFLWAFSTTEYQISYQDDTHKLRGIYVAGDTLTRVTTLLDTLSESKTEKVLLNYTFKPSQKLPGDTATVQVGVLSNSGVGTIKLSGLSLNGGAEPLMIFDGSEISPLFLKELDPERVNSVTVLKAEAAIKSYGEKGKNGVLIISSEKVNQPGTYRKVALKKETSESKETVTRKVEVRKETLSGDPLIIVDGVELESGSLLEVPPKEIESISVIKDSSEIQPYGEKGKNGVIIITKKKTEK